MHAAELSQLRRLLSSVDSDRQRGVAKSITVSISATQTHMPDVDTEMSINRRSPSLMSIYVGADHPWWRRPHGSSHNFTLVGTIFALGQADHSTLQVLPPLIWFFIPTFYWRLASKASMFQHWRPLVGSTAVTSQARSQLKILGSSIPPIPSPPTPLPSSSHPLEVGPLKSS